MPKKANEKRINELLELLNALEGLHRQLSAHARAKIVAMKTNDLPAVHELTEKERQLVARITERDGLRRQLMDAIGKEAGWPPHEGRTLSASQLALRCAGPQRSALLDIAAKLRERFASVARTTRIAGAIASGILEHLNEVFSAVRRNESCWVGYSGKGAAVAGLRASAFEAIG